MQVVLRRGLDGGDRVQGCSPVERRTVPRGPASAKPAFVERLAMPLICSVVGCRAVACRPPWARARATMPSSLGLSLLGDPSLPAVVTVGGLWVLSLGGVGLWCRQLSGRLTALACVSTLDRLPGWPMADYSTRALAVCAPGVRAARRALYRPRPPQAEQRSVWTRRGRPLHRGGGDRVAERLPSRCR